MKVCCVLAIVSLAVVLGAPLEEEENARIHGENGWHVPKKDGTFEWFDIEAAEAKLENHIEARIEANPVLFYLYNNANPNNGQQIFTTTSSIKASKFNPKIPTRFIIHGWTDSYQSPLNADIRDAWFTKGNFNIICIDWARARTVDYFSSVAAVPGVGQKVAAMIDLLHSSHGMSMDTLIVIGHSLGAHVAGFAGKNVKTQIRTIIGLDPAGPLFSYSNPSRRLCSTDAYYVQSIQTCGGKLGFVEPIGKGAFYPHGGRDQPGCGVDLDGVCSHERSYLYYSEAVRLNDFLSLQCSNYQDATQMSCGSTYSATRMGAMEASYMVSGYFYVPVNSQSLFGMGA